MDRVLMTGSAIVSVDRLLQGREPPTAINIFDLAKLLESIILHDEVVVLSSTRADGDVLEDAISRLPAAVFSIEAATPGTILQRYAARLQADADAAPGNAAAKRESVHTVDDLLFESPRGPEMLRYSDLLRRIHKRYQAPTPTPKRGKVMRAMAAVPGVRAVPEARDDIGKFLHAAAAQLSALPGDSEARSIIRGFGNLHNRIDKTGGSMFAERQNMLYIKQTRFVAALILRTQYYLMAAELLGVPYKPDSLRAPICWVSLGGSMEDILVEERLVQLAEEFEAARLRAGAEVIGHRAFLLRMPLFLRRILGESRQPADLVAVAAEIRDSGDAKRFREYAAALTVQLRNEEIEEALAGLHEYSGRLNRQYGKEGNEVVAALISAPRVALPVPTFDPATTIGVNALDLAVKSGRAGRNWWRDRRFSLISQTIKQAQKAKSVNGELERIFAHRLDDDELQLLHDLDTVAAASGSS